MNKKGFTLIELLAVLVIQAILALIIVPVVNNIISLAKHNSLNISANGLIKTAQLYYSGHESNFMDNDFIEFICNSEGCINSNKEQKLEYNGSIEAGRIKIFSDGKISICLEQKTYVALKLANDSKITMYEGTCNYDLDEYSINKLYSQETIDDLTNRINELQQQLAQCGVDDQKRVDELNKQISDLQEQIKNIKENVFQFEIIKCASSSELPTTSNNNALAVITDVDVNGSYFSSEAPTSPSNGMIWVQITSLLQQNLESTYGKIPIAHVAQYIDGIWIYKEAYIYHDDWKSLNHVTDSGIGINIGTATTGTFSIPYTGTYLIKFSGGSGGPGGNGDNYGGGAGGASPNLTVKCFLQKGDKLSIVTGGVGSGGGPYGDTGGSGGYNGGSAGSGYVERNWCASGGGGGGATTIASAFYGKNLLTANGGGGGGGGADDSYACHGATGGTGAGGTSGGIGGYNGGGSSGATGGNSIDTNYCSIVSSTLNTGGGFTNINFYSLINEK